MKRYTKLLLIIFISAAVFATLAGQSDAAYLNITGFETGNNNEVNNTSGGWSVQSTTKRSGDYAGQVNVSSTAANADVLSLATNGAPANIGRTAATYYLIYIRFATLPSSACASSGCQIIQILDTATGNGPAYVKVKNTGELVVQGSTSTSVATLSTGVWYRLELKIVSGATSEAKINGGTAQTFTAFNYPQDYLRLGTGPAGMSYNLFYDDIAISDSGYIGAGQVNRMDPDSAGSYADWTNGNGSTYAYVDDVPHDGDGTYIGDINGGARASTFNLESASNAGMGEPIGAVKPIAIVRDEGGSSAIQIRLRSSTTNSDTTSYDPGANYVAQAKIHNTNPSGGGAWTSTALDGIQVGVETNTSGMVRATALYAMVWNAGSATVNPSAATNITGTSATINSTLIRNNSNTINLFYPAGITNTTCNSISPEYYYGSISGGAGTTSPNGYNLLGLTPNTNYYFCARAYDTATTQSIYSDNVLTFTTLAGPPTMERVAKGEITTTTASITGNIANQNGASILEKGVCYSSTNTLPAVSQGGTNCTSNGTGTAAYTANITGLTANTLYYFRAYARNSAGPGYSAVDTFTTETTPPVGFPQIVSTGGFYDRNNATIHNIPMPTAVNADDLLLVLISSDGSATISVPAGGWTSLATGANGASIRSSVWYKFAVGNEGGTTVNFQTSASESMTAQVYRIANAEAVEAGTVATGATSSPDSPSLTPTWGATDSLWIPFAGYDYSSASVNSYPASYTNGRRDADTYQSSQTQGALMSARRYLNATTEDPAAFTVNVGGPVWAANTVVIKPVPTSPNVTTNAADPVGQTTATIKGNANPNTFATTGWFRYYTSDPVTCADSGGTRAPSASGTDLGSGSAGVDYSRNLTGLTPGTPYWVCAIASNTNGTGVGSPVRFDTAVGTPTSVTTSTGESGLGSFYVTLNGSANPNNFASYGFFELYNSDPGACLLSDPENPPANFLGRLPANSVDDSSLGSGNTSQGFSYSASGAGEGLAPNTAYWYCAFARNQYGTTAASSPDTFSTPDGPIHACDPPSGGNHTILTSCPFSGSIGGVDGGTGTNNTAVLTIGSARTLTMNPAQLVAWGSISMQSGASINLGSGSSLRRSPLWVIDADGDGIIGSTEQYIGAQPVGGLRRNTVSATYPYFSKLLNATSDAGATYPLDCNDNSPYAYRMVPNLVKDADQDGYKTAAAAGTQCVGAASVNHNGTGRTYYRDSVGEYTWLADADKLSATTDCYDTSAAPCPPSTPSLSNPSYSQVNVSWSATTGPAATGYDIQWCQGSTGCTPSTSISNVTSTYAHTGRSGSTIYRYHVIAKNAAGNSTPSTPQHITTSSACTYTSLYLDHDGDGRRDGTGQSATGWRSPVSVTNNASVGGSGWSSPLSVITQRNANFSYSGGAQQTNYAWTTNYGFNIPSGATITGVEVIVMAAGQDSYYREYANNIQIIKNGAVTGTAKSGGTAFSYVNSAPSENTYGGSSDMWGATLTPSDVNQSTFGVAVSLVNTAPYGGSPHYLYHVRMKVHYTYSWQSGAQSGCWMSVPAGYTLNSTVDCGNTEADRYQNLTGYVDSDGDGYGTGNAVNVCSGASLPNAEGHASTNTDCMDSNANVRPNQTGYFSTHRGDGSFDYDCDTSITRDPNYTNGGWYLDNSFGGYGSCNYYFGYPSNCSYMDCSGIFHFEGTTYAGQANSSTACGTQLAVGQYSDSYCTYPWGSGTEGRAGAMSCH